MYFLAKIYPKIIMKIICKIVLVLIFNVSFLNSQIQQEIYFESANPFAMSDVINDLDNQTKQEVYGILTIPKMTHFLKQNILL